MITLLKRALPLVFLLVISLVGLPTVVIAQCPPPPPISLLAEGEIGLFFDALGTETCVDIVMGVATPLYVVARVPEGGVAEFEIPELLAYEYPPELIMSSPAGIPPGSPYDPFIYIDACSRAERSDPSTCPVAQGDLIVIAMTEVIALTPFTGTVCFKTACPTIAGIVAKSPFYHRCDTGVPGEFEGWDLMCVGFGQAPVPVESSTWGAIKSFYYE